MVELLGTHNLIFVELQDHKFARVGIFLKIVAATLAAQPILSFRLTLYMKFDIYDNYFVILTILIFYRK